MQLIILIIQNIEKICDKHHYQLEFSVTGTAACHGISYPLTSKYNIPHGEACGITQDKVLLLNSKVEFDRIDKLSKQVGYSNVEEFSNEIYKLK